MDVLGWVRKQDRPSGTTFTDYVSGDMNSGERNTKINRLRHLGADEREILSNARCLSEGVDVPSLDGVAFIDPRKSQVDIVQAVGRAIRKSAGKTHGTIVIPVFIDAKENEQEALESSRFKPIWDVVNALRSHDDDLGQELDQLRISLGQKNPIRGTIGGLERIVFDLPVMCEQSFADGLRMVLVERTTASWMFWFGLLQQYSDRNNDARPFVHYKTPDGSALGLWVRTQRKCRSFLSPERLALLESLKGWSWDLSSDRWAEAFERLNTFTAKTGHARPSKGYKTSDGFGLRSWVGKQRRDKDFLAADRIALLESLNGWSWDPFAEQWSDGFERLKLFTEKTGTARPSNRERSSDGFNLGAWVGTQRRYKHVLSQERIALLESLNGWNWTALEGKWDRAYHALTEYVARTGHASPASTFVTPSGLALGAWVSAQRQRRDSLRQDRLTRLESLNGWVWEPTAGQWTEAFERLKAHTDKTGHSRIPVGYKTSDGFSLGKWVSHQRSKKDSLTADRISDLESLNGWSWDALAEKWNDGFKRLKRFIDQTGDSRPAQRYITPDGFALGTWVSTQRKNFKEINPERVALLESLPGWSWNQFADEWSEAFKRLKAFSDTAGHTQVSLESKTSRGFHLGHWVKRQRRSKDSLTSARIALLESLNGWSWDPFETRWYEAFKKLKEFTDQSGGARPDWDYTTTDGFGLGVWASRQRNAKKTLSRERKVLLESLKGWTWGTNRSPNSKRK
jgi:hypothetical protein